LGAVVVLEESQDKLSQLGVVWVDQGYSGKNFARVVQQVCGESVRVEVIQRQSETFEVLPKRWIVERTFGWLNRFRRLSKDYEVYSKVGEAMIYGTLMRLMLRRLTTA
jgi:transposase